MITDYYTIIIRLTIFCSIIHNQNKIKIKKETKKIIVLIPSLEFVSILGVNNINGKSTRVETRVSPSKINIDSMGGYL